MPSEIRLVVPSPKIRHPTLMTGTAFIHEESAGEIRCALSDSHANSANLE